MNRQTAPWPVFVFLTCLAALPLPAQLVNDGATATLANVTTNITGTVTVGTNGSFTLLALADNALLTNSANGVIGVSASARSNEVRLVSATARWRMATTLVGSNGAFNRLVISNGAQVISSSAGNSGIIGHGQTTNGVGNLALVTGAGSLWSNAGVLNVGFFGGANQLVVSNGARVHSVGDAYVGLIAGSTNNRVTVTDAGSLWSSGGGINVGLNGAGNGLFVRNGGGLRDAGGFIGSGAGGSNFAAMTGAGTFWTNTSEFHLGSDSAGNVLTVNNGAVVFAGSLGSIGTSSGASLNTATVADAGTMWVNGGELYVGRDGAKNRLFVSNGGTVTASNLFVGDQPTSTNNRVVVDAGTLRVSSPAGNSTLDVRRGTNQLLSGLIDSDRLVLTSAAGRFEFLGGTLVTRGASINNGSSMSVGEPGGGSAFWDVRPGLSNHFVAASVFIGNASSSNQLQVSGGAQLTNNGFGNIGSSAGADGNGATVIGPGSRWEMGNNLFVGSNGAFSRLVVSSGGRMTDTEGYVGFNASGSKNEAVVTGAGSTWINRSTLVVGELGPNNRMEISDGGWVTGDFGTVGKSASAVSNHVLVTGNNSTWSNRFTLQVGTAGNGNELVVSAGGQVRSGDARIGNAGSANRVTVTGAGSHWTNIASLDIGLSGVANRLGVESGARVSSGTASLGLNPGSSANEAAISGAGSLWNNQGDLSVGLGTAFNRLLVSNAGWVVNGDGYVGRTTSALNNTALVTGAGSVWSNRMNLTVGLDGAGNLLVVSDGGTVFTGTNGIIGASSGGNSALVSDAGSRWLVGESLFIGSNAAFNTIVVSNGAFVSDNKGFVGNKFEASNNLALITGPGSVWSNASSLFIGESGVDNQLIVSDGATLLSHGGFIGFSSVGNLAMVTGPGSKWNAGESLVLEYENNRLVVSNAALVINDTGHIGEGDRNIATVIGAGSLWSNRLELTVGGSGSANRLNIQSGGTVFGGKVFVGKGGSSANNRVVVQNGTLRAANAGGTGVLDVRHGTNVLNSGLVDVDKLVLANRGTIPIVGVFGNGDTNNLSAFSTIRLTNTVTGLVSPVVKVTVTLSNLSYVHTKFVTILLVSPAGQKVMLMSDAGDFGAINDARLVFDDSAAALLPQNGSIVSGTYLPTDYPPYTDLPSPAPPGPYSTNLSAFSGTDPNGVWSLYVTNDSGGGSLVGWSLTIQTPFLDSGAFEFNGGTLITRGAVISNDLPFVIGGPGGIPAVWEARAGLSDNFVARDLLVGNNSSGNQMLIPSGVVVGNSNVIVGASPVSSNNLLRVTGGTLRVLNPGTVLDVRGGTNRIDAGLVDLLHLVVTNTRGQFEMFGGTLRTPDTIISNGRVCIIGGGASLATFQMLGGTHTFANNLTVATNGSLIGTGVVDGTVTVSPGGRLTPGAPIGSIDVIGSVILQGTVNLQIDKSGGVRTSDEVVADGAIFYNGTLNVTDIGTDVLAAGDRFFLFSATPYVGAFTTLNLPPLGAGLAWKNNLSVDGSIEVIGATQSQPGFSSVVRSGANFILSGTNGTPNAPYAVLTATNVNTPVANWQSLVTNQFDAGGRFSFTNAIPLGIPQRFFQLRTP